MDENIVFESYLTKQSRTASFVGGGGRGGMSGDGDGRGGVGGALWSVTPRDDWRSSGAAFDALSLSASVAAPLKPLYCCPTARISRIASLFLFRTLASAAAAAASNGNSNIKQRLCRRDLADGRQLQQHQQRQRTVAADSGRTTASEVLAVYSCTCKHRICISSRKQY